MDQCRFAMAGESPITSAVSSTERPTVLTETFKASVR